MTKKIILTFLFSAVVLAGCAKVCHAADLTEADVKKIISEYVQANGEELANSINAYVAQEKYRKAEEALRDHSAVSGPKDAKVTFIEFSDYRCGYCKAVQETIKQLREKYKGKVKFAFKNRPILSEESRNAAFAAQAANKQGKFWEFHKELWQRQGVLGDSTYELIAKDLGLDMKKFNADRKGEAVQQEVYMDYEDGEAFGAGGTPFFLINGQGYSGAQPLDNFVKAIDEALAAASPKSKE